MAARPLLAGLRAIATKSSTPLLPTLLLRDTTTRTTLVQVQQAHPATLPLRPRLFHSTPRTHHPADVRLDNSSTTATTAGATVTPTGATPAAAAAVPDELDTRHAAFLGEADSNDAFEAGIEINPPEVPSLDATNAAFLGEADSDDGFEAQQEISPNPVESLDAEASAFLGEADSDDGFEGLRVVKPMDHGTLDPTSSAFHGEPGEHDHPLEK